MITIIFSAIILYGVTFALGYYKGKSSEKRKQIELSINNAIEVKKRQAKRNNDNISVVRGRMQKYIRK